MINYRHRNSSEPGNNFHKTKNAKSVQINATAGEWRFQAQNRNNVTVESSAYTAKKKERERKEILYWVRLRVKDFGMKKHSNIGI